MSLFKSLQELNELNDEFLGLYPKTKWTKEFKEHLKIDFTYFSNKIEGNKLPYGDTIKLLKTGTIKTGPNSSLRDITDLNNHKAVLDKIFEHWERFPISEDNIKKLHTELMKDPIQWNSIEDYYYNKDGNYRTSPIGSYTDTKGNYKLYMDAEKVPGAMKEFVSQMNTLIPKMDKSNTKTHPVTIAAHAHNSYIGEIHPFVDGNGRTGRIISSTVLMNAKLPPLIIKNDRNDYLNVLFKTNSKNLSPLVEFMAESLKNQIKENLSLLKSQSKDNDLSNLIKKGLGK